MGPTLLGVIFERVVTKLTLMEQNRDNFEQGVTPTTLNDP